ncbi:FixH family protein [Paenisporosarcina cavernae]|uniref:FixH family protein n=1 Tax=Paenisporosarcina cavernae TaxID=2320858 RepID=UPI0013C49AFB|nr:FixH family protein [Paenisporosarcina cavernae]
MKKLGSILIALFSIMLLAACGDDSATNKEKNSNMDMNMDMPATLTVDVQMPSDPKVNEEVSFLAVVKQEEELVEDADEVMFEIRLKGSDQKEMIESELVKGEGYEATYTFTKAGEYEIIPHTTARNQHVMPTLEITVSE